MNFENYQFKFFAMIHILAWSNRDDIYKKTDQYEADLKYFESLRKDLIKELKDVPDREKESYKKKQTENINKEEKNAENEFINKKKEYKENYTKRTIEFICDYLNKYLDMSNSKKKKDEDIENFLSFINQEKNPEELKLNKSYDIILRQFGNYEDYETFHKNNFDENRTKINEYYEVFAKNLEYNFYPNGLHIKLTKDIFEKTIKEIIKKMNKIFLNYSSSKSHNVIADGFGEKLSKHFSKSFFSFKKKKDSVSYRDTYYQKKYYQTKSLYLKIKKESLI